MTACATQEQTGRLLGGAAGAAAGSQVGDGTGRTVATIGGAIGGRMDDNDRVVSAAALENSRLGQSTRWVNPDTGNSYEIQPTRTFESNRGPCR
jgi:surface antigen